MDSRSFSVIFCSAGSKGACLKAIEKVSRVESRMQNGCGKAYRDDASPSDEMFRMGAVVAAVELYEARRAARADGVQMGDGDLVRRFLASVGVVCPDDAGRLGLRGALLRDVADVFACEEEKRC